MPVIGSETVGAERGWAPIEGLAQGGQGAPGVQYAQGGPPEEDEATRRPGPNERPLSDPELFRLELYHRMRSQLEEVDPGNPELRKEYLTGPEGFVPNQADVDALGQALRGARSGRPAPQGPVNTFDNPGRPRGVMPTVPSLLNNEDLVRPGVVRQEPQTVEPKPPGVIDESEARFKPKERRVAELLSAEGSNVKAVPVVKDQRTADAIVDGHRVEFKTPDPRATNGRIVNEVQRSIRGGGQARDIIVDARGSGLSEAEAKLALDRISGVTRGKLDSVRIVGNGFDVKRRYP